MKIVIVGPVYPYRGGIAHFTSSLAEELRNAGHEIKVVSFKRQYPKFLYPGKSDQDPSKEPLVVPAEFILDPLYPWTWEKARTDIVREQPDLVVFQWWTTFWAPAFGVLARRLKKTGIKVCFLIHNVFPHEKRFWDNALARFALKSADSFFTMAESQRSLLADLFAKKPVVYFPHPIYKFKDMAKMDKETTRAQLGIPSDRKVALFFGIVRPYKGLRLLVEAAGMLKKLGNPVHLLIAGEFWEDITDYLSLIKAKELEDWVTLHNRYILNEEVPLMFNSADVFVAPYTGGTQSGAVKLAMGYQLPIVMTPTIADAGINFTTYPGIFISQSATPESIKREIEIALQYNFPDEPLASDTSWNHLVETIIRIGQQNQKTVSFS